MTQIMLFPFKDLGSLVMKSIDIDSHGLLGINKGYNDLESFLDQTSSCGIVPQNHICPCEDQANRNDALEQRGPSLL